jgi:hypothetical protein
LWVVQPIFTPKSEYDLIWLFAVNSNSNMIFFQTLCTFAYWYCINSCIILAPAFNERLSIFLKPPLLDCFSYHAKEHEIVVCIMAAKFIITILWLLNHNYLQMLLENSRGRKRDWTVHCFLTYDWILSKLNSLRQKLRFLIISYNLFRFPILFVTISSSFCLRDYLVVILNSWF